MAIVTQTLTTVLTPRALNRPAEPSANLSPIPRSTMVCQVSGTIAAQGAADQTAITVQTILPGSFAYRLAALEAAILSTTGVNDYDELAYMAVVNANHEVSGQNVNRYFEIQTGGAVYSTSLGQNKVYCLTDSPGAELWRPPPESDITIICVFVNQNAAAQPQMQLDFTMTLYQYDIDQSLNWPVNTALLTL